MKNKKLLTIAALAGLTLGGLSVASAASAQSYGSEQDDPTEETSDSTVEVEAPDDGDTVLVQDVDESETDDVVPGETEERQRRGRGHRGGCNLEEAAAAIGIEESDLRAAIESGDSIADVAEANGVDVDVVIDAMVDAKAERIAEKVSEGRITQERADEKLADLEAKITDRVNGEEGAPEA
ncbi:MAG: hypothetical protein ACN4GZ_06590 [Acidimicrobiales bacterium]